MKELLERRVIKFFSKYYEGSKGNIIHFGVSKICNTAQLHQCEYVSKDYSNLYSKFCVQLLSFVSLILVLVCWKVVIDPPSVKFALLANF